MIIPQVKKEKKRQLSQNYGKIDQRGNRLTFKYWLGCYQISENVTSLKYILALWDTDNYYF